MKTSTLNKKLLALLLVAVLLSGMGAAEHYYGDSGGESFSVTEMDSGFSVPEYNSQAEIATELVAPFLFIVILLKFGFEKMLMFAFASDDHNVADMLDEGPSFSKEATLMAVTVAAMLIPTPFWDYVRLLGGSIGLAATVAVLLALLFVIFSFLKG